MTAALAVLAGVEGVAIGVLLYTRPDAGSNPTAPAAQVAAIVPPQAPMHSIAESRGTHGDARGVLESIAGTGET